MICSESYPLTKVYTDFENKSMRGFFSLLFDARRSEDECKTWVCLSVRLVRSELLNTKHIIIKCESHANIFFGRTPLRGSARSLRVSRAFRTNMDVRGTPSQFRNSPLGNYIGTHYLTYNQIHIHIYALIA